MTAPTELDLDAIELLASKATPGPWWIDSHGHCMVSQADGGHEVVFQATDLVKPAVRHPETGNLSHWPNDWDASFIAAANPAIVLELLRRLRAAEAAVGAKLSNGFHPSGITVLHMDPSPAEIEELKRLFSEQRTVGQQVLIMPLESSLEQLDEEQMRQAGWARAEQRDELLAALELAQSHIGWCWDQLEESTRLNREGSDPVHGQIAAAIANAKGGAPTT